MEEKITLERELYEAMNKEYIRLRTENESLKKIVASQSSEFGNNNPNFHRRCDEFVLSVRLKNILRREKIEFIWELTRKTRKEIFSWKSAGRKTFLEVRELLEELGLSLKE